MDKNIFKIAINADIDAVLELIQKRIEWMDKNNIFQWNKTNYLTCYPKKYFDELVSKSHLFVMKDEMAGRIIGAVALLEEDKRWNDNLPSYYIHNLVSDAEIPGIGAAIIKCCEKMAINNHKNRIRLDCQASNHKLNQYYQELGFQYVEKIQDGHYIGNKREKRMDL